MLDRGISITLDLYIFLFYENEIIKAQLRVVSFTKMDVGLLLLDLSKAFDCLPHRHVYGVSRDSCSLLLTYLSNRLHRVKITSTKGEWIKITKGVPQGSVLSPMFVVVV